MGLFLWLGPFQSKRKNSYQGGPGPGLDLGRGVDLGFVCTPGVRGSIFYGGRERRGGREVYRSFTLGSFDFLRVSLIRLVFL